MMLSPNFLTGSILPLAQINPLPHVTDHPQFMIGRYWILTNHMIMMIVTALIMLTVFPALTRKFKSGELVMTGRNNFFEAILVYMREEVFKPLLGDSTDRFLPFLWTMFFFILINNILGLLPLDIITRPLVSLIHLPWSIGGMNVPRENEGIFGTPTGNFYVTATLALISFAVIQFNGLVDNGVEGWLHHFLGGAPWWLSPVMVPVEIMGMLIKPFALAVRLAANMTAGHILLAVIIAFPAVAFKAIGVGGGTTVGVISVLAAIAILCLELFVAFLQAYLFAFLTALFISQLLHHDSHDGEHEEEGHEMGEFAAIRENDVKHHVAH